MTKYRVYVFLVLANLFWAGNYVFGKYVVAEMTPVQMTFVRWVLAIILLFPLAHFLEKPRWREVWRAWKVLLLLSFLGILGYNILLYEALRFTTPLNASLVNAINPALLALAAAALLGEKLSRINVLGLFISLAGVLLVLTRGRLLQLFSISYNVGDVLMLAAIVVWTFYTLIGRRLQGIPPIAATAVSASLGMVVLLPFFLHSHFAFHLSTQATVGILYIALFPSVCSFALWNSAIRDVGAGRAGIFLNLLAVFTALLSLLVGQSINGPQLLGGALVIGGVYLTNRKAAMAKASAPAPVKEEASDGL
ncbi:DMT family transporter [Gallaecimonas mangrovi]|uniref:DMT family transporter n=1 Tax=Gallaecimonas mangrovi TaxID=2291597 RepID=UPI000E20A6B6|nr:DMT family transporter [Gallaecimonas mangrovi]